jgi:hypothetical protein
MPSKLTKFQQAEQQARATERALEAEMKKRRRGAAEARRKVQEQKWQALGTIVEQAGCGDLTEDSVRQVLRLGSVLVDLGLGDMAPAELRELLEGTPAAQEPPLSLEAPQEGGRDTSAAPPVGARGGTPLPWEQR